ncbi:class I adenylate-forming enzyme family protein [Seohaeicola nanhaiensis]|uniref:Class I adenylate-forming enzyme family protein n=1 Tax=Seohaeicola nanhaiensis TaxID=1387282 RepID=A0ABV9KGA8_9RHOB
MTAHWHDYLAAQIATRPDARAVSDAGGTDWTYSDLDAACDAIAGHLRAAGVQPGDRVAVLIENSAAGVAALFAASRMGAIALPVNPRQSAGEIDRILGHARPAAVLFTSAISTDAAAQAARLGATPITGAFGEMHLATPFLSAPDDLPDVAVLLYTTGTTGAPKGVMLTHANLLFGGRSSATQRKITPEDRIYGVLPVSHVFGLTSITTAGLCAGAHLHFEPRFSAARLYQALTSGFTLYSGVPQMHAALMQYAKEQGYDRLPDSRLRYVSSGAAPLDPAWKRKAEAFYGVPLQNGFGMTESTAGATLTHSLLGDPDTSCGPALPGTELAIDESVPGGGNGVGEVLTRGPHVMKGYYRNPEATAAVLSADGWLRTGDLGRIDEQGRLHIVGRSKELIIHGGFNVYPPEVEAALNEHPQVIQCAVIGRRKDGDEEVLAFVQAAPDDLPDPDALRAFAAERLSGYKRPARIIVATSLPAAPTGKILKHRLLDIFADQLGPA